MTLSSGPLPETKRELDSKGSDTINIAIVGCGRWGVNHLKTSAKLLGDGVRYVCDSQTSVKEVVEKFSRSSKYTSSLDDVLNDKEVNAVIVASPAETHFEIARQCLESGKHVLVEKPMTLKSEESRKLTAMAKADQLILMAGHVLLYHGATKKLKELCAGGSIGKIQYIYSNRLNLGAIRSEENILWSFAPHDIAIVQYLLDSDPLHVAAHGATFVQPGIEDTTITYLEYPGNIHAHIFVSWLHPFKEHRLVVIGERGMLVFEDSMPKDKLKFLPKGFRKTENGVQKFEGDYEVIPFDTTPPLEAEHVHFLECIRNGRQPLTDGTHAVRVLEVLERAQSRLKEYA